MENILLTYFIASVYIYIYIYIVYCVFDRLTHTHTHITTTQGKNGEIDLQMNKYNHQQKRSNAAVRVLNHENIHIRTCREARTCARIPKRHTVPTIQHPTAQMLVLSNCLFQSPALFRQYITTFVTASDQIRHRLSVPL